MSARAPDRTTTAKNNTKSVFFMMFNFRVYERPSFYLRKIRPDTGKIDYELRTQTDCSVGTTCDELLEPRASFAGRRPIPRSISVAELLAKLDLLKGKQLYEGTIPLHLARSFTYVRRCMMSKGGQLTTPVSSLFDWPLFARQDVRISSGAHRRASIFSNQSSA